MGMCRTFAVMNLTFLDLYRLIVTVVMSMVMIMMVMMSVIMMMVVSTLDGHFPFSATANCAHAPNSYLYLCP
jgi:hypothetical protein